MDDYNVQADANRCLGWALYMTNNFERAVEPLQKCLDISQEKNLDNIGVQNSAIDFLKKIKWKKTHKWFVFWK